jgi:hypothetical protein
VFEIRLLRRNELREDWRNLHNEELQDKESPPNIIRVIRSRTIRWTGHVSCMGEKRNAYRILVGDLKERDNFKDLDLDERILLIEITGIYWRGGGLDWIDLA